MYNRIIYVMKDDLHIYPPCIAHILMMLHCGYNVCVIAENCDDNVVTMLESHGAKVEMLGNMNTRGGKIGKIEHWLKFKKTAIDVIEKIYTKTDILWLGTAGTAIALKKYLSSKPFILSSLELYDRAPFYKDGLDGIIQKAKAVVACEKNRARIMKQWYNLKKLPYVMPNKPYYEGDCEKNANAENLLQSLEGKKYILYQGILGNDRSLDTLAKALKITKEKYYLVVIGKAVKANEKEIIGKLESIYPNIIYGGYFPAPMHLYVTENANMAVAFYDDSSINNMFCAPNKIFEYSKYGIPMIASDMPGLQLTVEKYGAGICVDMSDSNKIAWAIDEISQNYNKYQQGSRELYTSVDNTLVMKQLLNEIGVINNESIC